jgi:uncharacterized glyoxalase superfamily protein PhnB
MTWIEIGSGLINLKTPDQPSEARGEAVTGFTLKVDVDDVDAHFARARAAGARILSEPEDGFWGSRVYQLPTTRAIA